MKIFFSRMGNDEEHTHTKSVILYKFHNIELLRRERVACLPTLPINKKSKQGYDETGLFNSYPWSLGGLLPVADGGGAGRGPGGRGRHAAAGARAPQPRLRAQRAGRVRLRLAHATF